MWTDAAMFGGLSESVGRYWIQRERTPVYATPATITRFVAPVARTALSNSCIPAAVYPTCGQVPAPLLPSRRQSQAAVVSRLSSGYGSLKRSKMTAVFVLKVVATDVQNAGEWSRSAIGTWPVAFWVPGAAQCRS